MHHVVARLAAIGEGGWWDRRTDHGAAEGSGLPLKDAPPKVVVDGCGVETTGQEETVGAGAVEEGRDTLHHAADILGMAAISELA